MLHFGNVFIPWGWDWGWGILGVLVNVIVILVIIRIIFRIVRKIDRRHQSEYCGAEWEPSRNPASKILDERYAKGEIDDEEYRRKKENLK